MSKILTNSYDHIREALSDIFGEEDPHDLLSKTPKRFVDYLYEFNNPFIAEQVLGEPFAGPRAEGLNGLVVQSNIPFRMMCSHHLLPAFGKCALGYIPDGKVVGLSKLARLVDAVGTSRPGMQELFCEEIVDSLERHLKPKGVMCVIQATHSCMACRGINVPSVPTATSCVRGVFRDVTACRAEFFSILKMGV